MKLQLGTVSRLLTTVLFCFLFFLCCLPARSSPVIVMTRVARSAPRLPCVLFWLSSVIFRDTIFICFNFCRLNVSNDAFWGRMSNNILVDIGLEKFLQLHCKIHLVLVWLSDAVEKPLRFREINNKTMMWVFRSQGSCKFSACSEAHAVIDCNVHRPLHLTELERVNVLSDWRKEAGYHLSCNFRGGLCSNHTPGSCANREEAILECLPSRITDRGESLGNVQS